MKRVLRTVATGMFLLSLMVPAVSLAEVTDTQSGFCQVLGWLVRPIGLCEPVLVPVVVTPAGPTVVTETVVEKPAPAIQVAPTIIEYSTTTQPIYNEVTNEYVTVQQTGVSEKMLDERIAAVLGYVSSLSLNTTVLTADDEPVTDDVDYVTREYLLKSIDKVTDRQNSSRNSDSATVDFNNVTLTGTSYINGLLGIGTASPQDILSVNGAVYLSETTPAITTNRLYNVGGDLFWDAVQLNGVVSATSSPWLTAGADVYRPSGNVGIGTTTPSSKLTVAGTIAATVIQAEILDTGGEVCNVEAYGAVGNNLTLNDAAIARAIAACGEGGTVYFPMGQFRISQPIVLDKPVTLRGAYSPRWSYSSAPRSSIRADFASFSGVAMVHVRDRVISGQTNHNNGGRLEYISLDGGSAGTNVNGIYFEGLVRDWKLTDVDISQTTGNGFESAVGTGSGNPRGFTIRGLSIYSADGHGFRATALNDSYIEDLLVVGNALRGIYMSSIGETKINNSRAVFNALEGLYIDGASSNGGMMFTDFSTDRNDRHGVRISLTGTTTVTFNGLLTRRDGANLGGGSETPYAGVAVIGSPAEKVAPVFINGLTQIVGVDDSGNPPLAPQVGVRVTNAKYVKIEGQLWGVNKAYEDGGGNERFIIEEDSIIKEGTAGVNTNPVPLYNNKWVASTTAKSLLYDGAINIGSSTEDRLLNIVAASGAGARFKDTTNNVTFDMRAEDFQAFFGTFSNHQLRFQTNNVSRMTIDTNGRVGIGTTTPVTDLSVVGDAVFTGALRDSTNSAGLNGFVLQTTGIGSRWVATSSLGFASGGASTFLSLTDTPSFFNAGRLPFTNTAGNALTDSSSLTFNGDTMQITSSVDQPALRLNAASVSTNSVLALSGPLSTTINNGKVFQVGVAAEAFGRGQFFTDGSYGIGSGAATRDTFFSRVATSTLLVSSDRTTSGLATLSVSGKIAVGTTTPDQALDVIGTIQSSVLLGGSVGLSTDANGNIIRTPSDERLKTNIQTIENPLDTLLALRGVQYEWLDKERFGTEAEIGFIAQEVDMQLPEVVRKGGDYWSLNTANIVAVVVEAMKEMWVTITGNQERIELLEARVSALESAQSGRQAQPAPEPVVAPEPQTDPVSPQPESEPVATTTESTVEREEVELPATEPTEPVLPPESSEQPTTATAT